MVETSKMTEEELDLLLVSIQKEKDKRSGLVKLKNLLSSKDFLVTLLSSEPFVTYCKSQGYNLSSIDIVDVALEQYLELFKGGVNN